MIKKYVILLLLCLCLASTSVYAGEWITDQSTGCKVWDEFPEPGKSISWSGKCEGGMANGQEILKLYHAKSGIRKENALLEVTLKSGNIEGKGTANFSTGNKYVGTFKSGRPDRGVLTGIFENGNRYDGEIVNGKKEGKGTMTWTNGDKYVGEWRDNKRNGKGTITFANGNKYDGGWNDDNPTSIPAPAQQEPQQRCIERLYFDTLEPDGGRWKFTDFCY